jgi:putative FmdB family regulatory protein
MVMPIYEYKCKKCGKEYEAFQRITESCLKSCKFCKGPVHKLVSRTSFQLKGSGWYVTDYGGKKPPVSETAETVKAEKASGSPAGDTATTTSNPAAATKTESSD